MKRPSLQQWFESQLAEFEKDPEFELEGLLLDINEQICEAMERQELNNARLAEKLGVSRAWVTRLLNGKPNITLRTLVEVAMALGLRVSVALKPPETKKAARKPERRRAALGASAVAEAKVKYGKRKSRRK